MNTQVKTMIRQIIELDDSITFEQKRAAMNILLDKRRQTIPEIIKIDEVCRCLHLSRPGINKLIKRGYLLTVLGTGDRILGIRSDSLARYRHPRKKPDINHTI